MSAAIALIFSLIFQAQLFSKEVNVDVTLNPAGSFQAKTDKVKGDISIKNGELKAKKISIRVDHLKTEMELRDKHLKEKLESKRYPTIKVYNVSGKNGSGQAQIKIKDVKKDISFNYTKTSSGEYQASFPLSLKDFGIEGINYMGVGVNDEVIVKVKMEAR